MEQDEKVDILFTQLQAAAGQINQQSEFMSSTKNTVIKQQLGINTLKSTVERQQAEITQLRAENERLKATDAERAAQLLQMWATDNARGIEMNRLKEQSVSVQRSADRLVARHDDMKKWYESRNTTLVEGFTSIKDAFKLRKKRVYILWLERCKEQEILRKHDHDSEDPGNPDTSASSGQPGASTSTQIVVYKPLQIVFAPVTSGGSKEELEKLDSGHLGESSTAGENVILALKEMKVLDDATIDEIPSEPEVANLDDLEERVFEGNAEKSKYVREDGTEFNPFEEDWLKDNLDEIDDKLKNRDSSDVPTDSFEEWRKKFLSTSAKPAPSAVQVNYMKYEKVHPHGRILSWMFLKDIHCMAVKREHGIQSSALAKLELINQSNYDCAKLFTRKLRTERRSGWKDELYKPQFPMHEQIKYTLDPATKTARYKLVYKPVKVLDKIPLMPMKQEILGSMALWCYDSDTHEAVIVFRNDEENFHILDPMWIVNMFAADIDKLFRHDIFYEDKDAHQALLFQRVAFFFCYYHGIHAGSSWSEADH
ncbi:hypothetical protein HanHA300_Chr08g0284691 [Helianthus annuus]|nr:hypothetical protein HanHA300_Chr08g0284691 [Helianthus annuus]KAJ0902088.1 hypothetical protein HanPSC8_Chr08g0332881 [Helianthus annuus]